MQITLATTLKDILKDVLPNGGAGSDNSLDSAVNGVNRIIGWALDAAGLVAVIMILYSALMYMLAYGEESKAETAKKTLLWSIVGIVFIASAKLMIAIVYHEFN